MTITKTDVTNTYVLSIGNKNDNHDIIEQEIVKELDELLSDRENSFYSTALRKYKRVYFQVIVALGDQPERRHINYLMNGNSLYGTRYGYACKIQDLISILPSCNTCENSIRNKTINNMNPCDRCLRWNNFRT